MRDIKKYSHGLSSIYAHISYKVKYCHKVFVLKDFREACETCFREIAENYKVSIISIGFDLDHIHMISDLGKYSEPQLRKFFKGISGKKLLEQFPEIKKKYFWGSGLWSGTKYVYSVGRDKFAIEKYVAKQKYFGIPAGQKSLFEFC